MIGGSPTRCRPDTGTSRGSAGDSGSSLVELVVVVAVLGLVFSAFYTSLFGFLRDAKFSEDLAQVERDTRPVIRQLVIELRQAEPEATVANGQPVQALDPDSIVFYSDRYPYDGPERHEYSLANCVDSLCDLQLTIHAALASSSAPNWEYDTSETPVLSRTMLEGVVETQPMFSGQRWSDVSSSFTTVTSCDRAVGSDCDFELVDIELHVDPNKHRDNPRVFEIVEQVRLRNADV